MVSFLKNKFRKQIPITLSWKSVSEVLSYVLPNIPMISRTRWEMAHNQFAKATQKLRTHVWVFGQNQSASKEAVKVCT